MKTVIKKSLDVSLFFITRKIKVPDTHDKSGRHTTNKYKYEVYPDGGVRGNAKEGS